MKRWLVAVTALCAGLAGLVSVTVCHALPSGDGTEAVARDADDPAVAPRPPAARVLRSDRGTRAAAPAVPASAPPPPIQPVIVPEIRLPAGVSVPAQRIPPAPVRGQPVSRAPVANPPVPVADSPAVPGMLPAAPAQADRPGP